MSGVGPYMESNEAYNPITGLLVGSAFGAVAGGAVSYGGVMATNAVVNKRNAGLQKKIDVRENAISELEELKKTQPKFFEEERLRNSGYVPGGGRKVEVASPDDVKKLMETYDAASKDHANMISELKKKKMKPITGGRTAGIIGGVTLGASLIGGTLGAIGNYE